jgi:hypothetical protein
MESVAPRSALRRPNSAPLNKTRRVKVLGNIITISKNEYNTNQQRKNSTRRNPKYTLKENKGNGTVEVYVAPPSQIEETYSKNNYARPENIPTNPRNKSNYQKTTPYTYRHPKNLIESKSVVNILKKHPYKSLPNMLRNVTVNNRNKMRVQQYLEGVDRSKYVSRLYAQAVNGRHPEEGLRILEDKLEGVRSEIRKLEGDFADLQMKKDLIKHVIDKIIRETGLRFQVNKY